MRAFFVFVSCLSIIVAVYFECLVGGYLRLRWCFGFVLDVVFCFMVGFC